MGILFVLGATLFFSAFYLLVDQSQKRHGDAMGVNLATFCAGALLAVAAGGGIRSSQFPPTLLLVGGLMGVTAGVGLLGITLAVRSGMPITVVNTAASLSLTVPILLSLAAYGEVPSPRKALGLAFAALSIFLIQRERK